MMAIKPLWFCPIQTPELVALCRHNVLEGGDEPWMKYYPGKWMPQIGSQFALMFRNLRRTVRRRKWCRKVEVKASIDSSFSRHHCGPLRILHEYHRAD